MHFCSLLRNIMDNDLVPAFALQITREACPHSAEADKSNLHNFPFLLWEKKLRLAWLDPPSPL
jgi:hypothetical protein